MPRSDLERMQGVWRVVVSLVGDELAEPDEMARRRVRITGDKLVYEYGNERQEKREGTIKLDPATQAFDWTVPLGNVTALATYKLKDDTLTIGFGNDGLIRPKHWKMGILDVCWLLVLQRERTSQGSTAEKPVWVADASKADIPDRPAGGRLHGKVFSVDKARITPWKESSGNVGDPPEKQEHADGAMLTLQAGEDRQPRNYITLFLAVKAGESVEGKTFVVSAGGLFKQTEKILDKDGKGWFSPVAGVHLNSAEPEQKPRTELLPKVSLRVEFGESKNNRLPGAIYLCVDDLEKSFVAGTFEATKED